MAAAPPPESEAKYIRFQSWRIQPEEEYAKRLLILSELAAATEGTSSCRFWKVMGQVDDWDFQDMNPQLLPKEKKVCIDQGNVHSPLLGLFGCQSPPPGTGIHGSVGGQGNGASSSSIPPPSTPAELGYNFQKSLSPLSAEKLALIEKNKAAALLMRSLKRSAEQTEGMVFEVMPWMG